MDGIIGVWNLSESIGGIYKRNTRLPGSVEICHGIPHVDRGFQTVVRHDAPDIGALGHAGITGAEMTFKVRTETAGLEEYFYIAGLAVADDEKAVFFLQGSQYRLQIRIKGRTLAEKCLVFFLTALVDQLQLTLPAFTGKEDGGNIRKQSAEQFLQPLACHRRRIRGFTGKYGVPCLGADVCGVPQSSVHIKNNTVHRDLLCDILKQIVQPHCKEERGKKQDVMKGWPMEYRRIREGIFISRPNRFIARVQVDGKEEICHVKNTGRCRELLVPGARVLLEEAENPHRKTRFDLVQVYKGDLLVNMDSQMPNFLVREWMEAGGLFPDLRMTAMEKKYGSSRFDLYAEHGEHKAFLEVKGVTLEENGIARFPDAPTQRGIRHMRELMDCVKEGYEAYLIFVIQMKGVHSFQPNWRTQPEFGHVLREAAQAGVQVIARDCLVYPGRIVIDQKIPVDFLTEME